MATASSTPSACPFLLRVFWKAGGHNDISEYHGHTRVPAAEVAVHGFPDTTLRDIVSVAQTSSAIPVSKTTRFSVSIVFPDRTGRYVMKEVGVLPASPPPPSPPTSAATSASPAETAAAPADGAGAASGAEATSPAVAVPPPASPETMTLQQLRVQPGDYIDIAVL